MMSLLPDSHAKQSHDVRRDRGTLVFRPLAQGIVYFDLITVPFDVDAPDILADDVRIIVPSRMIR